MTSINRIDIPVEHHQHNGNIKSVVSLHTDSNENNSENDVTGKIPVKDGLKFINIDIDSKVNDIELIHADEPIQRALDDTNKDSTEKYEHSLWKWPSGRSCITKVSVDCN